MPASKPSDRRYHTAAWRRLRETFLRAHPLCEVCEANGELVPATVADHRTEIQHGGALLDQANLRALCASCHAKMPGHFGAKGGQS